MKRLFLFLLAAWGLIPAVGYGQSRDFRVHQRGMLHETVYNTGELGRSYHQGQAGNQTAVPLLEWPAHSQAIVDGVQYDGMHNSLGGGIWIAADAPDTTRRMYAFGGGVGSSRPEIAAGVWSFPLVIHRKENFPVLADGSLNPGYDPDEAEEVIVARWATSVGITVTSTSRAWSYPDYDDFIIFEYEFEHTGDRDGNPQTVESRATLEDVLIAFPHGFAPAMFGYLRKYNRYEYDLMERNNLRGRFDHTRWMNYVLNMDGMPDPKYYEQWAAEGRYGGGLNAPAAIGHMMLYYDTKHLARVGQTKAFRGYSQEDSALVVHPGGWIKQPYFNRLETSNLRSSKIESDLMVPSSRASPYRTGTIDSPDAAFRCDEEPDGVNCWVGRGQFNHRQTRKAVGRYFAMGPYRLNHGDRVRFAVAAVAGFGAARVEETRAGLKDFGGSCGEDCGEQTKFGLYPVPNLYETVTYGGSTGNAFTYGSTYLSKHPLPSYVNSDVVTIRDVADRAKEAYTGASSPPPYWPAEHPEKGRYRLPVPVPAPALQVLSNDRAQNIVRWGPQVESFTHPRLQGAFHHYEVYKAGHPLGPWQLLATVSPRDAQYFDDGRYEVVDPAVRVGESFYYSVLSVDDGGKKSGRTNLVQHTTQLGGTKTLEQVYVVPNPFIVRSGFEGGGEAEQRIGFYNLPEQATIRIYSYSGQLVHTIDHNDALYSRAWFQLSRNAQLIASGVYFYVVETPDGARTHGKFVVIR